MRFDLEYAVDKFGTVFQYAGMTMRIAVISMVLTLVLALVVTLVRYYRIRIACPVVNAYIDLFRGTPLMVQLFFVYYGLPQIWPVFVNMTGYTAAIIGLTLNTAAYMTEDMRSALESVPRGQIEGGLAMGLTELQVMRHITLPQAIKVVIPILGNEFIALIKNSSMAFTLGVREIMAEAALLGTSSGRFFEMYLDAFIIYFVICKLISVLQKQIEKKLHTQGGGAH